MPRYARLTIANIPYHLIHRGNNKQATFAISFTAGCGKIFELYSVESQRIFLLMNDLDLRFSYAGLWHPFRRTSLKVAEEIVSENLPGL